MASCPVWPQRMREEADWSGYVPPPNARKYLPVAESKIKGGVGHEEHWKPKKKVFHDNKSKDSHNIIGGPIPKDDPSIVESGAWQSEAQAAALQTKTALDQKRESGHGGKRITMPAYELSNKKPYSESVGARLKLENPYHLNDKVGDAKKENCANANTTLDHKEGEFSLVGYRAPMTSRSYIEGLGAAVAASLSMDKDRATINNT